MIKLFNQGGSKLLTVVHSFPACLLIASVIISASSFLSPTQAFAQNPEYQRQEWLRIQASRRENQLREERRITNRLNYAADQRRERERIQRLENQRRRK
jgi:hypothetical protein